MSWESKLFTLYLLLALVIMLVKSLSLVWQLWFSAQRRPSPAKSGAVIDAHSLARLGLTNRLSLDFSAQDRSPSLPGPKAKIPLHALPEAERMFCYAWGSCRANVGLLRRLVGLTLLSSALLLAYNTTNILIGISSQKAVGMRALSGGMAEALTFFVLGMVVSVMLYAMSSIGEDARVAG